MPCMFQTFLMLEIACLVGERSLWLRFKTQSTHTHLDMSLKMAEKEDTWTLNRCFIAIVFYQTF